MQYYDVITNARWRVPANKKKVISAYLSENDLIVMKFRTLNQIVTTIKWYNFKFKMADGRHIGKRLFGHNSAADCPFSQNFVMTQKSDNNHGRAHKLRHICTKIQNPTA